MELNSFVSDLVRRTDARPEYLLQHLCDIQLRQGYIPEPAIALLSRELQLSAAHIRGVIGFYSFLNPVSPGDYDLRLSDNITDRMLGNQALLQLLCDRLGVAPGTRRSDGRVTVRTTSCTGMCDQGPAMLANGRAITRLDSDRVEQIVRLVEAKQPVDTWPAEFFEISDNIRMRGPLLENQAATGAALKALLEEGTESLLTRIRESGLRGRGGAGFDTATKWQLCSQAEAPQRYVVCNADEGEPGTFKDRVLLTRYADRCVEGMTLCAGLIGATRGYIYLRAEYAYLKAQLEARLQALRDGNLLGERILGKNGFDFDIEIRLGAGAYICGEESALIESLEGKRGIPRSRPPFPVTRGYLDQPTVVNNVETFMAAALIGIHGADWFRAQGTQLSPGTRLLSISGDCARPGIYEYPWGVSVDQVLRDCGGEGAGAVQVAGAAGTTLSPDEFDRRIAFEDLPTGGSFMVFGPQRDPFEATANFSQFFLHESCGFCTPCRVGNPLLNDLLHKLQHGKASAYDIAEIRKIASLMRDTSQCGLGKTAPNPVLDLLEKFPESCRPRLDSDDFEPAFDLDAALNEARNLAGRDDPDAHLDNKQ